MQALWNTLALAIVSALIATLIGTIACIAMQSMKRTSRAVLMGITNIPMLNAEIVTGISLMLLFLSFGIKFGFGTILLAHITFNIPYVILSVMPRMKQLNPSTYEAALDLGASHTYAFFKVVFPDILPGILSGFLMAFTMSLDDFIIPHFTKGPGVDTLSTKIYTEVKKGIKPEMYAPVSYTHLPFIKITDYADTHGIRRPDGKIGSLVPIQFHGMCSQLFIDCIMNACGKTIHVFLRDPVSYTHLSRPHSGAHRPCGTTFVRLRAGKI